MGQHYIECGPESLSEPTKSTLIGVILGDGRIEKRSMRIINTNKEYLDWLDNRLGWLSTGITVFRTPDEVRDNLSAFDTPVARSATTR